MKVEHRSTKSEFNSIISPQEGLKFTMLLRHGSSGNGCLLSVLKPENHQSSKKWKSISINSKGKTILVSG